MITLPAELTQDQASNCLRAMMQGLPSQAGPEVLVDGRALNRFDSSALAVLLELRRQCQSSGKELRVTGLPKQLMDLARLYGVAELLPAT